MTVDIQTASATIGGVAAPVESVDLILDRTWSPYGQGSVTVGGLFADLDPDATPEPRFRLRISQRFSYGLTASEIAALLVGLTASQIAAPGGPWGGQSNLYEDPADPGTFIGETL